VPGKIQHTVLMVLPETIGDILFFYSKQTTTFRWFFLMEIKLSFTGGEFLKECRELYYMHSRHLTKGD